MSKIKSWDKGTSKFSSRLSKWKLNTLSIDGRLILLKLFLTLIPLYHVSIFNVPIGVLNKLESICGNFFNGVDGTLLRARVPDILLPQMCVLLVWSLVSSSEFSVISVRNYIDDNLLPKESIQTHWVKVMSIKLLRARVHDILLPQMCVLLVWSLVFSSEFSVISVRNYIDDNLLPKESIQTRWVKVMSIKVNIMAWKVWLDNLPTRFNLSSSCPLCNMSVESTSHLFFSCSLACQFWNKMFCWWDIDSSYFLSYDEWLTGLKNIRMPKVLK
nr:RNA-directed DNA polymerase, eukaryota [Tanacetum cinerariifolium]